MSRRLDTHRGGVRVFAPGKLIVVGEYAVLHGERALVAAVDSGIECRSTPRPQGWWLTAPDLGVDAALPDAVRAPGAALLAAAVRAGVDTFGAEPQHLVVRGRGPGTDRKTGLGGSAASTVAVLGCLGNCCGRSLSDPTAREELFDLALAVHRGHQQGWGSGADLAASVFGGWLDYRLARGHPRVSPAPVPADFLLAVAWSGVSTDTTASLQQFEALPAHEHLLRRMSAALNDFWAALHSGVAEGALEAVAAYGDLLNETARELGVPEGPRIAELVRAAGVSGAAAKGSGAVGGDCVVAVDFDVDRLRHVRAAWEELGADVLDLATDPRGVRLLDPDD